MALEFRAADFRLRLLLEIIILVPPLRLNSRIFIVMVHHMVLIHFKVAKTILKRVRERLTVCTSDGAGLLLVW